MPAREPTGNSNGAEISNGIFRSRRRRAVWCPPRAAPPDIKSARQLLSTRDDPEMSGWPGWMQVASSLSVQTAFIFCTCGGGALGRDCPEAAAPPRLPRTVRAAAPPRLPFSIILAAPARPQLGETTTVSHTFCGVGTPAVSSRLSVAKPGPTGTIYARRLASDV